MTEDKTHPEPSGDSCAAPCSRHFVCPDGDLHSLRAVSAIWLDARPRLWKSGWVVTLEYEDGEEFKWWRATVIEAKAVRARLIEIFSENSQEQ